MKCYNQFCPIQLIFFISICFIFFHHRKILLLLLLIVITNLLLFYGINFQWSYEPSDKYVVCLKEYEESRRMRWYLGLRFSCYYKTIIITNLERTSFTSSWKFQPIIKEIQGRNSTQQPAGRI